MSCHIFETFLNFIILLHNCPNDLSLLSFILLTTAYSDYTGGE
jgi:hypothetical protein